MKNIIYESRKGSFPKERSTNNSPLFWIKNIQIWSYGKKNLHLNEKKDSIHGAIKKTSITIESILGREGRKWRKMILFYCLSLPQKFLSNVFENYHNFLCFFKTNKNSTILSDSHMRRFSNLSQNAWIIN